VPPAACLGFPGQAHEGLGQVGGGGVDLAHGLDVEAAQAGLAGLDAPDLGFGPFELLRRDLDRQPFPVAQFAQVPAELPARHGRSGGFCRHGRRPFTARVSRTRNESISPHDPK